MFARRLTPYLKTSSKPQFSSSVKAGDEEKSKSFGRKAVSFVLITITGGVALSGLNDLAIYHGCSSKAMEKANRNQAFVEAIGEPVVKGPWYNASLAVAHKRHSVSCTFPVSGPKGTGVLQLKAMRNGDDTWLSYIYPRDWEIIVMDALLHIPENEEKRQTLRMNLSDHLAPPSPPSTSCTACISCTHQISVNPGTK